MDKLKKLVTQIMVYYYLHQLKKDQWKDPQQLKEIQFRKLKAILKHAYNYVPYYRKLFSAAKIKPDDIKNPEDLRKIPTTSKRDVQKYFTTMVAKGMDASKLLTSVTSGSTGIPLKILHDYSFLRGIAAVYKYNLFERGVRLSDNFVAVWGRGSGSIQWGKKYVRLWGEISRTVVPLLPPAKLVNVLRFIKPDVLDTFPSVLHTLANYGVSGIHPRIIFTGGEMVTQGCREIVRKTFGLEPFETYGSVEFGDLAFECNEHLGLHIITDSVFIEFVDENGEYVSLGEQGEIIVTGLWNYAMPLIRYKIGDLGLPTDEKCSCGRSWPIIRSIQGRNNDFLILPSGNRISWLYLLRNVLYDEGFKKNLFCVSQYQLVQERCDKIVFKFVKGAQFDPMILEGIKSKLENEFAKHGARLEVVLEEVEQIPSVSRTGKRQLFISKVIQ